MPRREARSRYLPYPEWMLTAVAHIARSSLTVAGPGDDPHGSLLVLDDYHQVQNQDVHETVNYLVDNLPGGVLLVIVSRADPPLPVSRLLAQGRLSEIRGADLRFEPDQVAEYFRNSADMELDADQARIVAERSDGWVLALQLVNLSIDHHE
ncbi:MAG: hypothetical protein IH918_06555, partial [Acidobacteria bacterium]|nr:hypothetical protein [Acidobacteriota bacterium]